MRYRPKKNEKTAKHMIIYISYRIRHVEESYEELVSDDTDTDGDEDDDEIFEENRERMQIIANNSKYHGLNSN